MALADFQEEKLFSFKFPETGRAIAMSVVTVEFQAVGPHIRKPHGLRLKTKYSLLGAKKLLTTEALIKQTFVFLSTHSRKIICSTNTNNCDSIDHLCVC